MERFVIIVHGWNPTSLEDESPTFVVSNIVQRRKKTNSLCELYIYILKTVKPKFLKST